MKFDKYQNRSVLELSSFPSNFCIVESLRILDHWGKTTSYPELTIFHSSTRDNDKQQHHNTLKLRGVSLQAC